MTPKVGIFGLHASQNYNGRPNDRIVGAITIEVGEKQVFQRRIAFGGMYGAAALLSILRRTAWLAAEQGNVAAQGVRASWYECRLGVPQHYGAAARWYAVTGNAVD